MAMTEAGRVVSDGIDTAYAHGRKMGRADVCIDIYGVLRDSSRLFWDEEKLYQAVKAVCDRYRNQP